MGDRQHQNVTLVDRVDQSIGKTAEAAATHILIQRMPSLRIERDAIGGGQHFDEKGVAETRGLRLVPVDRLVELDLGNPEKPDRHERYFATISFKSLAARSP